MSNEIFWAINNNCTERKNTTMQVSYNGFTGELAKLEKKNVIVRDYISGHISENNLGYDLSIYESEKNVTHFFTGVKLEEVKFLGGAVSFGG